MWKKGLAWLTAVIGLVVFGLLIAALGRQNAPFKFLGEAEPVFSFHGDLGWSGTYHIASDYETLEAKSVVELHPMGATAAGTDHVRIMWLLPNQDQVVIHKGRLLNIDRHTDATLPSSRYTSERGITTVQVVLRRPESFLGRLQKRLGL